VVNAIIGLFREVKTVFQSHVLRPAIRELLEAGKFDSETYNLWGMVSQDENEAAPKRVTGRRVKALELIGQAMAKGEKGIVWEEDFRQFLAEVVKRYNLEAPLQEIKRELEQRGEVWPDEAFSAPKEVAKRATAAAAMLKFSN
jgi:hypothetical protein